MYYQTRRPTEPHAGSTICLDKTYLLDTGGRQLPGVGCMVWGTAGMFSTAWPGQHVPAGHRWAAAPTCDARCCMGGMAMLLTLLLLRPPSLLQCCAWTRMACVACSTHWTICTMPSLRQAAQRPFGACWPKTTRCAPAPVARQVRTGGRLVNACTHRLAPARTCLLGLFASLSTAMGTEGASCVLGLMPGLPCLRVLPAGQDPMSLLVAAEGGGQAAGSVLRTPRPMPLPDFRFLGCALHLPPAFSFLVVCRADVRP